jgi:hypothetical protein
MYNFKEYLFESKLEKYNIVVVDSKKFPKKSDAKVIDYETDEKEIEYIYYGID